MVVKNNVREIFFFLDQCWLFEIFEGVIILYDYTNYTVKNVDELNIFL